MSNLDVAPAEVTGGRGSAREPAVLPYRNVPLGGPRAMPVRRSLPQRAQSLVGAWCFVDHYGPDDVSLTGGTTGGHAIIRPGQLNLMTAGSGIAHSEYSTAATTVLHGAQLWIALPAAHRFAEPGFAHYEPPVTEVAGATVRVFLGTLCGQTSPVPAYSPLVGAEVTLAPGTALDVAVSTGHEHGFLCDTGRLSVDGAEAQPGEIVFCPAGAPVITLHADVSEVTRILVLGGEPLGEQIVMWWNFIGRTHEEVAAFREDWQRQRAAQPSAAPGRYGVFPQAWTHTLPAPDLPAVRLRPRG